MTETQRRRTPTDHPGSHEQYTEKPRDHCGLHEYRIRFRVDGDGVERQVLAVADRCGQTITVEFPDGVRATIDVVTARAVYMLLHQAVYSSLEPTGPLLRLERNTAHGWALAGAGR